MHHWKQIGMLTLYVAIGIILAGMLTGVASKLTGPLIGTATPPASGA